MSRQILRMTFEDQLNRNPSRHVWHSDRCNLPGNTRMVYRNWGSDTASPEYNRYNSRRNIRDNIGRYSDTIDRSSSDISNILIVHNLYRPADRNHRHLQHPPDNRESNESVERYWIESEGPNLIVDRGRLGDNRLVGRS